MLPDRRGGRHERSQPRPVQLLRAADECAHDLDADLAVGLRLIRHAPDDHAGMVPIAADHRLEHGQGLLQDALVLDDALLAEPLDAPPVDGQFLEEEDAHPVTEREELGVLRVMGPDQVDAGPLHQSQFVLHERPGRIRPESSVLVVAIDAANLQWFAVQEQLPAPCFDRTDPERRANTVDHLPRALQGRDQGVHPRRFGRPGLGGLEMSAQN